MNLDGCFSEYNKIHYLRDAPPNERELELSTRADRWKRNAERERRVKLLGDVSEECDEFERVYRELLACGADQRLSGYNPLRNMHNRYEYPPFKLLWDDWTEEEESEEPTRGEVTTQPLQQTRQEEKEGAVNQPQEKSGEEDVQLQVPADSEKDEDPDVGLTEMDQWTDYDL